MARPNWEYIRIDVLMPEHPKVEGLSDRAFRALVELWCYCGRQRSDGIVTSRQWKAVPPKVRAELVSFGLAKPMELGGALMHDYLDYNRSRKEIEELSAKRAAAGRKGGSKTAGKSQASASEASA